ncbi:MAG: GAP family protein [Mycobacterium sp.]
MWITLLVMAGAASLEPFRIGMTLLMLNRPRPALQLFAFLCGGFAMGTAVGLVVLFVFRPTLMGPTHFTLPRVQIVIGVLALLVAAVLAVKISAGRFGHLRSREPRAGADSSPGRLWARAWRLLKGRSSWVAGAAGLGIALPSVDYLAALAVIVASRAGVMTQVAALLMFHVLAFALAEIPLVTYLVAPDRTRTAMAALNHWIRRRRRRESAALLAGVGCVLLAVGVAGL